jgi:hypothetical protein
MLQPVSFALCCPLSPGFVPCALCHAFLPLVSVPQVPVPQALFHLVCAQVPGSRLCAPGLCLLSPLSVLALRLCVPGSRVVPLFQVPAQVSYDSRHASPGFMPLFRMCHAMTQSRPILLRNMPHCHCHMPHATLLHCHYYMLHCHRLHVTYMLILPLHYAYMLFHMHMLHVTCLHAAHCHMRYCTSHMPLRYMHMLATLHKHSYMLHADMLHANMLHVVT